MYMSWSLDIQKVNSYHIRGMRYKLEFANCTIMVHHGGNIGVPKQ